MIKNFIKIMVFFFMIFLVGCSDKTNHYDIANIYNDEILNNIMKGEIKPVEIVYGMGGEGGYEQYSTKDLQKIDDYITAFRKIEIDKVITDSDEMVYIFDGIEDYTFVLKDGTAVCISTDLSTYIKYMEKQYVLEKTEDLQALNENIRLINGQYTNCRGIIGMALRYVMYSD